MSPTTPVAIIQDASIKTQRVIFSTLVGLGDQEIEPPAVIVVGKVVDLAQTFGTL